MPDRSGELSTFPGSLDQFKIKKPINTSLPLGSQDPDALEHADHLNHMFDAVYNIEQNQYGQAGQQVQTYYPDGTGVGFGDNLKMAYHSYSATMSGNLLTISGTVPAYFGSNPFNNFGFSMAHTTYFQPSDTSNIEGLWANKDWGNAGPWNSMIKFAQLFTMVTPGSGNSGRDFTIYIKNQPMHSTGFAFDSHWTDNLNRVPNSTLNPITDPFWKGTVQRNGLAFNYTPGNTYGQLVCSSEDGGYDCSAYVVPIGCIDTNDSSVQFNKASLFTYSTVAQMASGEYWNRSGPMVRCTGDVASANFYCLAIGDVLNNRHGGGFDPYHARLLKVTGENLTQRFPNGSGQHGALWGGGGTVTDLLSGTTISVSGGPYRLKVVGNQVSVENFTASGWILVPEMAVPVTDATPLPGIANGLHPKAGWFVKAMDHLQDRHMYIDGPIIVTALDSSSANYTVTVQCLFAQINEAHMSTI